MQDYIKQCIAKNDVVIFIKGEPTDTTCGYSSRAIQILNHYGVDYAYENVMQSEDLRKVVKVYSGVKTLPQIFMNGTYFGGSDDIRELHEADKLATVFQEKNITSRINPDSPVLVLKAVEKSEVKSCGQATAPRREAG